MSAPTTAADAEGLLVHDGFVRGVVRALLRDEHEVDDVVQETWTAALRRSPGALAAPRAWLAAVALNFARRAQRAETRRRGRELFAVRAERAPSTEEIVRREEARVAVVCAVLALPEPYRETLLLRYFDGAPPRRIASVQGVPVDTVQSRLRRGLAKVRARLERGDREWASAVAPLLGLQPRGATAVLAAASTKAIWTGVAVALLVAGAWLFPGAPGAIAPGTGFAPAASVAPAVAVASDAAQRSEARAAAATDAPAPASEPEPPAIDTPSPPREGWLASPDDPCGALVVRVLDVDGGAPLERVDVRVLPYESTDPLLFGQWTITDANGIARFARVAAGSAWIVLDRLGAQEQRVLRAGETTEVELRVARGVAVAGVVLDEARRPVEGAEVLLDLWSATPREAVPAAVTNAEGAFHVDHVDLRDAFIGARARGFDPSDFVALKSALRPRGIEIVLGGRGASVWGRVLDPSGAPAAGALVLVGDEERPPRGKEPGLRKGPAALRALADSQGRFRVWGLPAGRITVQARAHRAGAWTGTVEVGPGATGHVEARLEPEVVLEGTARDATGAPAAHAWIQVGLVHRFASRWISADADGSFRVPGLAAGPLLVAVATARAPDASGETRRAEIPLSGAPGETLRWDPVLR